MENNRLCYISRNYRNVTASGNKAKTDNEISLQELGAVNLGLRTTHYDSKIVSFFLDLLGVIAFVLRVRKGDVVVLQYPVKKYFSFLCNVAHLRKAHVIALIHDLGSMRRKKLTVEQEVSRLMHADYVIASNTTMMQWLIDKGFTNQLGALELFDYRSQSTAADISYASRPVVLYAGALARRKNSFLMNISHLQHYVLRVCGNRSGLPDLFDSDCLSVVGFRHSEQFIADAGGHYGLVWDGSSCNQCTGSFGEYLRLNSPHKASFYLRAGLPLIVWSQSALAPIVKSEGIGICIDSIGQIDELLPAISQQQWDDMRRNVLRVSDMLASGGFFKAALTKIMKE